jgi:hypothetical protein
MMMEFVTALSAAAAGHRHLAVLAKNWRTHPDLGIPSTDNAFEINRL